MTLEDLYKKEVVPALKERFGYKNILAVPKVVKVVVNTGIGRYRENKDMVAAIERDLGMITGQKAVPTMAKKAIAGFKIREGLHVGFRVTLRGKRMYDFLERLIKAALPRSRDFRGVDPKAIDTSGNFTIGIREHIIFPETIQEEIKNIFGLEVTVGTTAKTKEEAEALLRLMGFPLKREPQGMK